MTSDSLGSSAAMSSGSDVTTVARAPPDLGDDSGRHEGTAPRVVQCIGKRDHAPVSALQCDERTGIEHHNGHDAASAGGSTSVLAGPSAQPRVPVASTPPSTRTVSPVIHAASSDTRNPTSAATSSGVPSRFMGYAAATLSSPSA